MFGIKIKNMRKGPFSAALAFFDLGLGDTADDGAFTGVCEVRGCVLKKGAKGFYVQFPAKKREKDGEPVKDDKGYVIYDNHFDLFIAGEGEDRKPTTAAWDFRKELILAAQHMFETPDDSNKGRGAAKPKAAPKATPKPAEASGEIAGDEAPSPTGDDDEDDSLPF